MIKRYLFVSDFDQTLSFNDSGIVLSDLLAIARFPERVAGLSRLNLVQQGAELAYLLRHDPEYRRVRREHLVEVGRRIRLKRNVALLIRILEEGFDDCCFEFRVVSAAPEEVIHSALHGVLRPNQVVATRFGYDSSSGEIDSIERVAAGHGKVAVVEQLRLELGVPRHGVIYVGDGSSDIHVMLHVNRGEGFTIAASEARDIAPIARRTIVSDDAISVLVPVLEEIMGYDPHRVRGFFEGHGLVIQEWDKARTDWLRIEQGGAAPLPEAEPVPQS